MKRIWLTIVAIGTCVAASEAAESMTGRWAEDEAHCSALAGGKSLTVSDTSLRWREESCRVGRQYRTGDTLHLEAFCMGEGGERPVPVSLRLAGTRIVVTWGRVLQGELQRCP